MENKSESQVVKTIDIKALFAALKPAEKLVDIPGVGQVLVRGITQKRNEEIQEIAKKAKVASWKYVLVESVFQPDGSGRVFKDADIESLGDLGEAGIKTLLDPVLILNGWKKDESEKNSQATQ